MRSRRPTTAVNERVAGPARGFQWAGAGVGHRMPNRARWLRIGLEAGELGSHRWLGVAGTCRGGKRESGVAGLEGGGWGLAPNTQTEHDGSEWGWRWANGAHAGGLGLQGPAAVVNERVGGPAWDSRGWRLGFDTKHPNRARRLGMGLEVGEWGSHWWFGVAETRRGGKRESGVAGLEGRVCHRTPKPSATARNGVGRGRIGLAQVVWGCRDPPRW